MEGVQEQMGRKELGAAHRDNPFKGIFLYQKQKDFSSYWNNSIHRTYRACSQQWVSSQLLY